MGIDIVRGNKGSEGKGEGGVRIAWRGLRYTFSSGFNCRLELSCVDVAASSRHWTTSGRANISCEIGGVTDSVSHNPVRTSLHVLR